MTATPGAYVSMALADRYRLERELGQGRMATVYLATVLGASALSGGSSRIIPGVLKARVRT
jgi:hypothetical protein